MQRRFLRQGFSLPELFFGIAIMALLVAITLPALARARQRAKQTVCAANLKGLGHGLHLYATDYRGRFPNPMHLAQEQAGPQGRVTYVRMIGSQRGSAAQPRAGASNAESTKLATTRAFWMLLRMGVSEARSCICPSARDEPNRDPRPRLYWDFGTGDQAEQGLGRQDPKANWRQVSYGYQVPFGKRGRPHADLDPGLVVAADKGPYGAVLDGGVGQDPGVPELGPAAAPNAWRRWNSPNHGFGLSGEGQNVLYLDAHVEFTRTPLAGPEGDNIYTQWAGADVDQDGRAKGKPPTADGREVPLADTDTLIYP